nr:endonuclease/exonuclease/phosphatase family protein [Bifidobacterium goeldii]
MLPEGLQALPYMPVVVALTPWFTLLAIVALLLAVVSRRWLTMLIAIAVIGGQVWWQKPFFSGASTLQANDAEAISATRANTSDMIARVMTFNVYKGQADAQAIVDTVRDQRVEILALQETTDEFIDALNNAGIHSYLPYSQISSSDGKSGNGLWSATPLSHPVDDEVGSGASFMPGGTISFGDGKAQIRFVSVHTVSPKPGYWKQWRQTLDELALMRSRTDDRYVFMGDFNSTMDHTPFRAFLGTRFRDATMSSGHGFTFTWPADKAPIPRFADIDHIVIDQRINAGQMQVVRIVGSDHAALLGTIEVGE